MFQDKLTTASGKLLKAVRVVTIEINNKKQVILEAEQAIRETQEAIQEAKNALSM